MLKHGVNKKNKIRLMTVIFLLLSVLLATVSGVTFAKLYGEGGSNTAPSAVATPVAKSYYKAIYRTALSGGQETVAFVGGSDSVTVNDVEPNDTLDIYYAISDSDGARRNEVLLRATVTVCVRLEMIVSGGNRNTEYFAGWKEYGSSDGVKNGGLLQVYGVSGNAENEIRTAENSSGKVDYTGGTLLVETEEEKTVNRFGFYISPEKDSASEYVYHIRFVLPAQGAETESYAGARLFIDINALFEQSMSGI